MLPDSPKMPWPPTEWAPYQRDLAVADAWYSGDTSKLIAQSPESNNPKWRSFRGKRKATTTSTPDPVSTAGLHLPVAADIASVGADLLFGDTPSLQIPGAHAETKDQPAVDAEARLAELAEQDGWASLLLEGAEIGGALGGVYLRPVVDTSVAEHPLLDIVHADRAVPEFRYGRCVAVTFWREWPGEEGGQVWRHLERHSPGLVEHGLYLGTSEELGTQRHLMDLEQTAALARTADGNVVSDLTVPVHFAAWGVKGVPARYVPNALPNPKHRQQRIGRSDTAGTEFLMDALDETWTSWVRDIRLAKARLIVPDEFLDHGDRGKASTFDTDREIFSPLNMDPAHMEKAGIELVQPEIRFEAHAATAEALFTQIIQRSGYSPQSFGMQGDGAAITATEVDAHEGRSDRTTGRKRGYWTRPLEDIGETMLHLLRSVFQEPIQPARPKLTWPDAAEADMRDTASTLNLINLAKAASTEVKVQMLHPDWTPEQVKNEAKAIREEDAVQVEDPMADQV